MKSTGISMKEILIDFKIKFQQGNVMKNRIKYYLNTDLSKI